MRTWRARNPVAAAYNSLVHHARARKIQVTITRPEFVAWAMEVGLFDAKLRRNTDLHVDRRDAVRGYSLSNIQVLRYDENIAKGNRERHYPDYKAQRWAMLEAPCGCEVEEPF